MLSATERGRGGGGVVVVVVVVVVVSGVLAIHRSCFCFWLLGSVSLGSVPLLIFVNT